MKKNYFFSIIFTLLSTLSIVTSVNSQALVLGDIAFTGYNSNGAASDEFSFIVLRTGGINIGTSINFTDCGWNSLACGTNDFIPVNSPVTNTETEIAWTSTVALPYGTQVRVSGLTATTGNVLGTALNLSGTGDQIFAFQGPRTGPYTMLAGIHMNFVLGVTNAANWDNATTPVGTNGSNRPPCLTNGTYALFITNAGATAEVDNAILNCTGGIPSNPVTARALINNSANWSGQDATAFVIHPSCAILPVHLLTFTGKNKMSYVELAWTTVNEDNFYMFHLERSYDGKNFTGIADINPRGGSGTNTYSHIDNDALRSGASVIYYRLKNIDIDGKFTYSAIVSVKAQKGASFVVNDLANPVLNSLDFTVTAGVRGKLAMRLTDINGKLILQKEQPINTGDNSIHLGSMQQLAQGTYILDIQLNENRQTFKLIKN